MRWLFVEELIIVHYPTPSHLIPIFTLLPPFFPPNLPTHSTHLNRPLITIHLSFDCARWLHLLTHTLTHSLTLVHLFTHTLSHSLIHLHAPMTLIWIELLDSSVSLAVSICGCNRKGTGISTSTGNWHGPAHHRRAFSIIFFISSIPMPEPNS